MKFEFSSDLAEQKVFQLRALNEDLLWRKVVNFQRALRARGGELLQVRKHLGADPCGAIVHYRVPVAETYSRLEP